MPPADTERLPVPLKEPEVLKRGKRLAALRRRRHELDEQLREAKARHKAAVAELEREMDELAVEVDEELAAKEVKVQWKPNFESGQLELWRLDTKTIVAERCRPLTADERQTNFDDVALAAK